MRRALACPVLVLLVLAGTSGSVTEYTFLKADPAAEITYHSPAISPDGRTIAYVRARDRTGEDYYSSRVQDLYLARLQDGHWKHRLLSRGSDSPVWSTDGVLAFDRKGVAVYNPHTGRVTQLTRSRYPKPDDSDEALAYYDSPVRFSPDGRYVVYEHDCWEDFDLRLYDRKLRRDMGVDIGNRLPGCRTAADF